MAQDNAETDHISNCVRCYLEEQLNRMQSLLPHLENKFIYYLTQMYREDRDADFETTENALEKTEREISDVRFHIFQLEYRLQRNNITCTYGPSEE